MTPKTTLAAILTETNAPLVVDTVEIPDLVFGQVLVKIHYSTICGSQINEIEGTKGPDKYLPHLLGHEGAGEVLAVAQGVTRVKKGDHVVLHWRPASGIESLPSVYKWKNKKVNAGRITTFQQYSVVSENRLTVIPKDFDLKIAPLFGCAVTTALGVVNNDAAVKIGQSVIVFGVGGVGLNIVQGLSLVSACPIIAIDLFDEKLAMAKKLGATHTINSSKSDNISKSILDIIGANGADVVIDVTGNTKVIQLCYDLTSSEGKTVLVGVPKKGDNVSIYTLPLHFNKTFHGSHGGSSVPDVDIPRYIKLVKTNKLKLDRMITHQFSLSDINTAIQTTKNRSAGKILLKMF
jgi:S-(hydroxymethyl)glutathione dehydrogenase / alcohol dehydrogenase